MALKVFPALPIVIVLSHMSGRVAEREREGGGGGEGGKKIYMYTLTAWKSHREETGKGNEGSEERERQRWNGSVCARVSPNLKCWLPE